MILPLSVESARRNKEPGRQHPLSTAMGLLGEILTRTYFESQQKTSYVVRSTLNLERPLNRRAA